MHKTLMNTWNQKAHYYGLVNQSGINMMGLASASGQMEKSSTKLKVTKLEQHAFKQWLMQLAKFGLDREGEEGSEGVVTKVKTLKMFNRQYKAAKDLYVEPPGNSNIEFSRFGKRVFGRITLLFKSNSDETIWLLVRPFETLRSWDAPKNPYKDLKQLNTQLLYANKLEKAEVVHQSMVVGHIAILENVEGTFGISRKTISAVSLGNVVSDTYDHFE